MRIYLDNCCYNRPYDDKSLLTNNLESQAKLFIQDQIKQETFELVSSYMLHYEVFQIPDVTRRLAIMQFIEAHSSIHVGKEWKQTVEANAKEIMATGIKFKDACHVASAIMAHCDYFITTDKRLLKYHSDVIAIINPVDFVMQMEVSHEQ